VCTIPARSTVKFIRGLVRRFGVPNRIITDNGSQFTSGLFRHQDLLRLRRLPQEQWSGRACQCRSPQGPQNEKLQRLARSLRQEMVRQPPIHLMVHSYHCNQAYWGDSILPSLRGGGCPSHQRQIRVAKGARLQRAASRGPHQGSPSPA
jgi:hypothetical protein